MPQYCCVPACTNSGGHRFPFKRPDIVLKWRIAIKRTDPKTKGLWNPSQFDVVCKQHFNSSDYLPSLLDNIIMANPDFSRYMKALALSFGPCADVLHLYFENKVIEGKELCDFLNETSNKHILFHENTPTVECCECSKVSLSAPRKRGNLGNKQFYQLFFNSGTNQPKHFIQKNVHGKDVTKQYCLCSYLARTPLAVEQLDITMMCTIINKCCQNKQQPSILELKGMRDILVHPEKNKMDKLEFDQLKIKFLAAATTLAKLIGNSFANKIKGEIEMLCNEDRIQELQKAVLETKEDIQELRSKMNGMLESGNVGSALVDISNRQKDQSDEIRQMHAKINIMYAQFGKVQTITDVNRLPECEDAGTNDENTHEVLVTIKTPEDWDKAKIEEKITQRIEKDESMNSSKEIQLISFKFRCLLLETRVSSYLLRNRSELMCAVGRFLKSILEDCEIDLTKPETLMITVDVKSSETPLKTETSIDDKELTGAQAVKTKRQIPGLMESLSDLKDNTKRWLFLGIALHETMAPVLRKYVFSKMDELWITLKHLHKIDIQTFPLHLQSYRSSYFNYESINNNRMYGRRNNSRFDYNVKNSVDLSKLFLQPHMAHYKWFDEDCDLNALLTIIEKTENLFSAKMVRYEVLKRWSNYNSTIWNATKYECCFQLMEDLVKNIGTEEEYEILVQLKKWKFYELTGDSIINTSPDIKAQMGRIQSEDVKDMEEREEMGTDLSLPKRKMISGKSEELTGEYIMDTDTDIKAQIGDIQSEAVKDLTFHEDMDADITLSSPKEGTSSEDGKGMMKK